VNKTISIIGCAGIPSRYGGFETLAEQLSIDLSKDFHVKVICSNEYYTQQEIKQNYYKIERIFLPLKANGLSSIFYDIWGELKVFRHSDCLLILGSSAAFFIPVIHLFKRKLKVIYHPDGIEWKRKKWNSIARFYLRLSSYIGAKYANTIIVDNSSITPYYNRYKNKIVQIGYGGDHYNINTSKNRKNYWLTIARAEPENNLETVADFFRENENENWVLVSNLTKTKFGRYIKKKYSHFKNFRFIDSTYNPEVIKTLLEECKGYIHGHSSGGTNPSLVAAMWAKTPLICHDNTFNRSTTRNFAAYFSTKKDLVGIIQSQPIIDSINISRLYEIAVSDYSWEKINKQYKDLFKNI